MTDDAEGSVSEAEPRSSAPAKREPEWNFTELSKTSESPTDRFNAEWRRVSRHYDRLLRARMRRLVAAAGMPDDLLEDLLQELWIKAVEGIGTYTRDEGFASWLARIGQNVWIDWLRQTKMQRTHEVALPPDVDSGSWGRDGQLAEAVAGDESVSSDPWQVLPPEGDVAYALGQLLPKDRELAGLVFAGYKHPEIAEYLGITAQASRQRWVRIAGLIRGTIEGLDARERRRALRAAVRMGTTQTVGEAPGGGPARPASGPPNGAGTGTSGGGEATPVASGQHHSDAHPLDPSAHHG